MNSNWILKKDGWHKKQNSVTKGTSPFTRPAPPVRDGATGHPIRNGKVDWARVIRESNEKHNGS